MAITADHAGDLAARPRRSLFGRILEGLMEARMAQAQAYVKPHLLGLDDAQLKLLGHTREEVAGWKKAQTAL